MMSLNRAFLLIACLGYATLKAQPCTPQGDETSYGLNDIWIGYIYDNVNFTSYQGYVNEGISGNPSFNQSFGGSNVSYNINGCAINTETYSARYKLRKSFSSGNYEFITGGDDGYRLSIDGGATWIINRWFDQGYNTTSAITFLNGTYDLVLEFYENAGGNQVSFVVQPACLGTGSPSLSGTNDIWQGYVYDGVNFTTYLGDVTEGAVGNPNFDQSFGGSNAVYNTNTCSVQTETFSVRYRLRKNFASGTYIFLLGGDDGYRFSLDGGATWAINAWADQSYNTASHTAILNGTYDLVIEYYENGGDNRISFDMAGTVLPVKLVDFTGNRNESRVKLEWIVATDSNPAYFDVERSQDGLHFQSISRIAANLDASLNFQFQDRSPLAVNSYYRLKLTGLEGASSYSAIIFIKHEFSEAIRIFPGIIRNRIVYMQTGRSFQDISVEVFDMAGRKINSTALRSITTGETISITLPQNIRPGTYIVHAKTWGLVEARKIVVSE